MCVKKEVFCQSVLEGLCETQCDCGSIHRRALSIPGQPSHSKNKNTEKTLVRFFISRHEIWHVCVRLLFCTFSTSNPIFLVIPLQMYSLALHLMFKTVKSLIYWQNIWQNTHTLVVSSFLLPWWEKESLWSDKPHLAVRSSLHSYAKYFLDLSMYTEKHAT